MKRAFLCAVTVLLCVAASAAADEAAVATRVLDLERGSFRAFMGWRTVTLVNADGQTERLREPPFKGVSDADRKPVPVRESLPPAPGWAGVGFDDSDWVVIRSPAAVRTGLEWQLVCLRGAFLVDDPARVGPLTVAARFHGGVRVLVNGAELTRAFLPKGEVGPWTLADAYGEEAGLRPDGKPYLSGDAKDKALARRMGARVRTVSHAVPAGMLRKGLNVVAIEVHAAPVRAAALTYGRRRGRGAPALWPRAAVLHATVEAGSTAGLTPNAGPLPGLHCAVIAPTQTVCAWDYAHPSERPRPIRLESAANACCSGRVLVSSSGAIKGLTASAGNLTHENGSARLPASAVRVRWAEPARYATSWLPAGRFDGLSGDPPAEVAPTAPPRTSDVPASAAVPVWVTVRVPPDAAPGNYAGALTIKAESPAAEQVVPIRLKVHRWRMPDPADFTTANFICQSPDTVSAFYKTPLWSEKHLTCIGKSLKLLGEIGGRVCVLNLVAGAHGYGNTESMVLWVRKDDGTYDYDFTPAEKYMDAFAAAGGKPWVVQVNVWMFSGDTPSRPKWPPQSVTVVDRAGRRLDPLRQPPFGTAENEAFWRPVLVALGERLIKRHWWDVTRLGWLDYCRAPHKSIADVAVKIWPDVKWIKHSHSPQNNFYGVPVTINSWVWGAGGLYNPDRLAPWGRRPTYPAAGRLNYPRPWDRSTTKGFLSLGIPRWGIACSRPGLYAASPLMRSRIFSESALQGNLLGIGMVGGDFWPLPAPRGRRRTLCTGQGGVTATNNTLALLSPGPDGAVASERFEMFREGVQTAEMIIYLRKAVLAGGLGADLVKRINVLLDSRARDILRNQNPVAYGPRRDPGTWLTAECMNRRRRNADLLALADEAAAGPGK